MFQFNRVQMAWGAGLILLTMLLATAVTPAAPTAATTAAPALAIVNFYPNITFNLPVDIAHAGDNRLFIVEKAGRIRVAPLNTNSTSAATFLDITSRVEAACSECGLLGLAFHPDYASNGRFFVNYTHTLSGSNALVTRISEFAVTANPDAANPNSEIIRLQVNQPFSNHNAGDLNFGPDGYLYVGLGDGGSGGDPQDHGQNPSTLLGSMLRLDVDGGGGPPECAPGGNYTIPATNPFVADNDGKCNEIWATGLRNPWRFSFDQLTGDMFIGDVGQNLWEEVNFQPATSSGGENYGWNCYEGTHLYTGTNSNTNLCAPAAAYDMPIFEAPHGSSGTASANSITGGFVYRGNNYPGLIGSYVVADFVLGNFWTLIPSGGSWQATFHGRFTGLNNPSTFGEDVNGELYVADYGDGQIYHVVDTTVYPAALTIRKSGPAAIFASTNTISITYTLLVFNEGTEPATNLTIRDTLPVGSTYAASSHGGTLNGDEVIWQIGTLAGRASTAVTLTINFSISTGETAVTRNTTYSVTADGGLSAVGASPVVTIINPEQNFLPAVQR